MAAAGKNATRMFELVQHSEYAHSHARTHRPHSAHASHGHLRTCVHMRTRGHTRTARTDTDRGSNPLLRLDLRRSPYSYSAATRCARASASWSAGSRRSPSSSHCCPARVLSDRFLFYILMKLIAYSNQHRHLSNQYRYLQGTRVSPHG